MAIARTADRSVAWTEELAKTSSATKSLRHAVESRLDVGQLASGASGPFRVAFAVRDTHADRKSRTELRPAVVLFDLYPQGHSLHDFCEFTRHDVARQERELRSRRFVDPDHSAPERLAESVDFQRYRIARCDASQSCLFQVGRHVSEMRVVHAQDGNPGRGEIAKVTVALDDDAGKRCTNLRVFELILSRNQALSGFRHILLLERSHQLAFGDLGIPGLGQFAALGRLLR